jgi:uncharacterized protein YacL
METPNCEKIFIRIQNEIISMIIYHLIMSKFLLLNFSPICSIINLRIKFLLSYFIQNLCYFQYII